MLSFSLTKRLPTGSSCISNRLRIGRIARYITQVTQEMIFFNQKRELFKFKNAFSAISELHIILGPPSTRKTALVHEVTSKGDFNPLYINYHEGQFDIPERIYDSISSQFEPFFKKYTDLFKKLFKKGEVSYMMNDIQLKVKLFGMDPFREKGITPNDISKLLDNIGNAFPSWTHWNGYNIPPPILVIDEANKFSQLGCSESGEILLKSILDWMVVNKKEKRCFNIVLTSFGSFFFNWIVNLVHILHATPYVVGDLNKEEAEEYFETQVLPQYEYKELQGKFDHICKITGTHMLIIDKYVKEYKNYDGKFKDSKFSVYGSEYNKLKCGFYSKRLRHSDKPNPALWKDYDLIKTMEAIVKAENQKYILEDDLIKEIGSEKVDSLVDYNFLHHRPTTQFANDITDPPDKVILIAMNQPSVRAMEHLLSKLSPSKK
ncbi:15548_t:CDS:2 [Gigaspora margarita]|uniref:15548_t:CDS:1 n=1 Tax=Gigaspora margarita TaxID=4874 RepID=A0ABN7V872_GIGMA|nr:15548_t:CDS:2 [Gigaspora margarita]